jgi:histidyl-tRNA synthetase
MPAPTPGIGFGAGIERALLAREREGAAAAAPGLDVFFVVDGADRAPVLRAMAELRRRGLSCDTDYAGRSLKGQMTQAGRTGARTVVIAGADGVRVRSGGEEREVMLADLVDTLSR